MNTNPIFIPLERTNMSEYKMGVDEIVAWHRKTYQWHGEEYYLIMKNRLEEYVSLQENPDECRGVVENGTKYNEYGVVTSSD